MGRGWRGPAAPEAEKENLTCISIIYEKKKKIHMTATIASIYEYGIKLEN